MHIENLVPLAEITDRIHDIVAAHLAEATHAKLDPMIGARSHFFHRLLVTFDTVKQPGNATQFRDWWIVGVDSHFDSRLFRHREYCLRKITIVLPHLIL